MALLPTAPDPDRTVGDVSSQRASVLRSLARQLDEAELHHVLRAASYGVWAGPAADECSEYLLLYSRALRLHAEHLRSAAAQLDIGM